MICTKCHIDKPESEYHSTGKGYPKRQCKACECKRAKEYYKKHKEAIKAKHYHYKVKPPKKCKCFVCGKDYYSKGGQKKTCSQECNRRVRPVKIMWVKCDACGSIVCKRRQGRKTKKQYCTQECYLKNWEKSYRKKCKTCDEVFTTGKYNTAYCSDICNPRQKKKNRIYLYRCEICGNPITSRTKRDRASCGYHCKKKLNIKIRWENKPNQECKNCNKKYKPKSKITTVYCGEDCRKQAYKKWQKKSWSGKDHKRRAIRFGAKYECVDPLKVFERDKYRCLMCGIKTPKKLTKTNGNEPNEPTIDHIIPMSLGGDHTYENVQTLCRSCNTKKSATTSGQIGLALFGKNSRRDRNQHTPGPANFAETS